MGCRRARRGGERGESVPPGALGGSRSTHSVCRRCGTWLFLPATQWALWRDASSPLLLLTGNASPSHWDGDPSFPSTPEASAPPGDIGAVSPLPCTSGGLGRELPVVKPLGWSRTRASPWGWQDPALVDEKSPSRRPGPPPGPVSGAEQPGAQPAPWQDWGGSVARMQPRTGASTLRPAPAWAPPRQRGPAVGSPRDGWEGAGQEPTAAVTPPRGRSRLAPRAVPSLWLGRGCQQPLPPPCSTHRGPPHAAGKLQTSPPNPVGTRSPPPNNCRAKYSPAGGLLRTPAQSCPLPGGPCHQALRWRACQWAPLSLPRDPTAGGLGSPQPGSVASEKGEMPAPGLAGPLLAPLPQKRPLPQQLGAGGCGGSRSLPTGGAARAAQPDPVSGGNFSQGWRRAEGGAGPARGFVGLAPLGSPPGPLAAAAPVWPASKCFSLLLAGGGEWEPCR